LLEVQRRQRQRRRQRRQRQCRVGVKSVCHVERMRTVCDAKICDIQIITNIMIMKMTMESKRRDLLLTLNDYFF